MELGIFKKALLTMVFFGLALFLAVAGGVETGKNAPRVGQAARNPRSSLDTKTDNKTIGQTSAKWLADPEHGWIRDEKQSAPGSPQNRSGNPGGKASGIFWEY
jgi:hypothetical protein